MSENLGEPESVDNERNERRQQEPEEPIQTTDDLDRKKDENGDKNKGQEGVNTEEIENNKRKRKRGIEEEEEEIIIEKENKKENKKIYICGVCNKKVNKGCVKCNGCEKWIHRRYVRNKPNCSALKSNEVYVSGVYICPTCVDPTKKHKGPGRPAKQAKRTNTMKTGPQMRYGKLVSRISLPAKDKRKAMEEETPEKNKSIGEKEDEKTSEKSKLKTDGNKEEKNRGMCDKDKNGNKKSLISCGGANLSQADIESLENGGLVTDEIIQFFMQALLEYVKSQTDDRINVVGPSVAYLIQTEYDKRVIESTKKGINLKDYDWVIYPINDKDDPDKGDGGTHWSLIVYNKKENVYLYFDPLKGMNIKYAKALHLNLIDANSYGSIDNKGRICHYVPPLVEVNCQKQANGYDCGIFIMAFMATIMKNIVEGREVEDNKDMPYKTDELRKLLLTALKAEICRRKEDRNKHNIIQVMEALKKREVEKANEEKQKKEKERKEKEIFDKEARKEKEMLEKTLNSLGKKSASIDNRGEKSSEEDNNGIKKDDMRSNNNNKGNDKREEVRNNEVRPRKKCWFFMNRRCRNGNDCRYEHPERSNERYDPRICELWSERGSCPGVNGGCKRRHPRICRSFNDQEECRKQYCNQVHPRIPKRGRREAQSRYFENTGYHNDGYRAAHHGYRGTQREHFLHHQGTRPYKRKPSLHRQEESPYMEDRAYIAGGEMSIHRAILKEIVREEMENRMMRGMYPREEVAYRIAERGSHAR